MLKLLQKILTIDRAGISFGRRPFNAALPTITIGAEGKLKVCMSPDPKLRLLLFNLATDADDPALGFTTGWINALATHGANVHVITMRAGRSNSTASCSAY